MNVTSAGQDPGQESDVSNPPEHYIAKVNNIAEVTTFFSTFLRSRTDVDIFRFQLPFAEDNHDEMASRTKLVDSLKTALRTQPHSFVLRFVEQGGLPSLLNALHSMDEQTGHSSLHNAYIGCIKALMNNSVCRDWKP